MCIIWTKLAQNHKTTHIKRDSKMDIESALPPNLSAPTASIEEMSSESNIISASSTSAAAKSSVQNDSPSPASTNLISVKVRFIDSNISKTLQFNATTLVFDALKIIREKIPETSTTDGNFLFIYCVCVCVCF